MGITILEALQEKFPSGAMKRNITLKLYMTLLRGIRQKLRKRVRVGIHGNR